jgi:hypothetical protein
MVDPIANFLNLVPLITLPKMFARTYNWAASMRLDARYNMCSKLGSKQNFWRSYDRFSFARPFYNMSVFSRGRYFLLSDLTKSIRARGLMNRRLPSCVIRRRDVRLIICYIAFFWCFPNKSGAPRLLSVYHYKHVDLYSCEAAIRTKPGLST